MKKLLTIGLVMVLSIASAQKTLKDKEVWVKVISCETGKIVMENAKKADVPILLHILNFEGKYYLMPLKKKGQKSPPNSNVGGVFSWI